MKLGSSPMLATCARLNLTDLAFGPVIIPMTDSPSRIEVSYFCSSTLLFQGGRYGQVLQCSWAGWVWAKHYRRLGHLLLGLVLQRSCHGCPRPSNSVTKESNVTQVTCAGLASASNERLPM